jgi:hypothetical protein
MRAKSLTIMRRSVIAAAFATVALGVLAAAAPSRSAVSVSRFTMTPSTTQVGAHPTLDLSVSFEPPTSDVKSIVLHLPAGLTANAQAAPFCPRGRLLSDLCPLATKVGTVTLVGEALGFQAEAKRNMYNLRLSGAERLRLGVPIFGSLSRGGIALTLPVTSRPADRGLDVAIAGPPREVAGYPIRIRQVSLRLQGLIRRKGRRGVRKRALLTNPRSCQPAVTLLEITAYEGPPATLTQSSVFTPTGC